MIRKHMMLSLSNRDRLQKLVAVCFAVAIVALSIFGVRFAYAETGDSSTSSSPNPSTATSPSATSNKPETSSTPGTNGLSVEEIGTNAIDTAQLPDSSFLYDTSINALMSTGSYYDNQIVQVTGEAVGDSIRSGFDNAYRWITLTSTVADENDTVAVYMSNDFAKLVDGFGAYGRTGTILQVRGTFHLACSEHDGTTDLHAENVSVVEVSESHPDAFSWLLFVPGLLFVVIGAVAIVGYRIIRERMR